jgi:hypothetical protein
MLRTATEGRFAWITSASKRGEVDRKAGIGCYEMWTWDPAFGQIVFRQNFAEALARHNLELKVPKGGGWLTNPRQACYNRVYDRSTLSFWTVLKRLFR